MIGPIDSIEFRMTSNTAENLAQLQYRAFQYNYCLGHAVMRLVYFPFTRVTFRLVTARFTGHVTLRLRKV